MTDLATAKDLLVKKAERQHAEHRQYDGRWRSPEYRLARMTRNVTTKFGLAFEKGDLTIARVERGGEFDGSVFAYSFRNQIDTAIRPNTIEFLEGA